MQTLYTRQGREHTDPIKRDGKGKPCFTEHIVCGRCGGAGGSIAWRPDGGICYECRGARFTGYRDVSLYTAEQLEALNARKAKADEKRAAKKAAEAAEAAARLDAQRAETIASLPEDLQAAYRWGLTEQPGAAQDIAQRLHDTLYLSEKQSAYLVKLHAMAQEQQVREAIAAPCPVGRVEIVGTVVSTKWQENGYGGALKMLLLADAGFKLWGSVPSSLLYPAAETPVEKGTVVRFTATVEPSRDDKTFGFFSRPTKAACLTATA